MIQFWILGTLVKHPKQPTIFYGYLVFGIWLQKMSRSWSWMFLITACFKHASKQAWAGGSLERRLHLNYKIWLGRPNRVPLSGIFLTMLRKVGSTSHSTSKTFTFYVKVKCKCLEPVLIKVTTISSKINLNYLWSQIEIKIK